MNQHMEQNALTSIVALQHGLANEETLAKVLTQAEQQQRPVLDVFEETQLLTEDNLQQLKSLVTEALGDQNNNLQQTLQTLGTNSDLQRQLQSLTASLPPNDIHDTLLTLSKPSLISQPAPSMEKQPTERECRYRIQQSHAKGGLGEVFVATDEELNRNVALKEIQAHHADHAESRARFLFEAEVTGRLEHPGVVPVYGLGTYSDGRPYYAMRFIRGESLQQAISAFHKKTFKKAGERALELRQLLHRFIDACNALCYAHCQGILHRDIKPDNIMLGEFGETLVVDWGLAKSLQQPEIKEQESTESTLGKELSATNSNFTQTGSIMGTPGYMSPEQAAGKLDELFPASDIYSLGATLYTLLTNETPSGHGVNVMKVLENTSKGNFPSPRARDATIPKALNAICLKAMALKPADRYGSAKELIEDLERWLADEPVKAYHENFYERFNRWRRRHQTIITLIAALVITSLTIIGISSRRLNKEHQARIQEYVRANEAQVDALIKANPQGVRTILDDMQSFLAAVRPRLQAIRENPESSEQAKIRAAIALLPVDDSQLSFLKEKLIDTSLSPGEMLLIREALAEDRKHLIPELVSVVEQTTEEERRFRALVALAEYEPSNQQWWQSKRRILVDGLLASDPVYLGTWTMALMPVRQHLIPPLQLAFMDERRPREQHLAASVLQYFVHDNPELLVNLVKNADAEQFQVLLSELKHDSELVLPLLKREPEQPLKPIWDDPPLNKSWPPLSEKIQKEIEQAGGMVHEQLAFCATLSTEKWKTLSETMQQSGYRPTRFRPYLHGKHTRLAVLWTRDGRAWRATQGLTADQLNAEENKQQQNGYHPIDVSGFRRGENEEYAALWVKSVPSDRPTQLHLAQSFEEQRTIYQKLHGIHQPLIIHAFQNAKSQMCFPWIWQRREAGPKWWQYWQRTEQQFLELTNIPSMTPIDVQLAPSSVIHQVHYNIALEETMPFTSKTLTGLTPQQHQAEAKKLQATDYRPISISVQAISGKPDELQVVSLWHRPRIKLTARDDFGRRRANLALSLYLLGEKQHLWPMLKLQPYPEERGYLIERMAPFGIPIVEVQERLENETDVSTRRALILSLGQYTTRQIFQQKLDTMTKLLLRWYQEDPDPGIHSAIEWLMNQWNQSAKLEQHKSIPKDSRWTVNSQGQTMMIVRQPKTFLMGQPREGEDRTISPVMRYCKIPRSFAVSTKEITNAQFQRFLKDYPELSLRAENAFSPKADGPVTYHNWYVLAMYCRWLSEQEKIPEDQMCFPKMEILINAWKSGESIKLPANYLSRTGYRMLTEAEWEYVARAGTRSPRHYGSGKRLLDSYAWYTHNSEDEAQPVGMKKPNDFGLFDVLGNAVEWTMSNGSLGTYSTKDKPVIDREEEAMINDKSDRVIRGSSYKEVPRLLRCGVRQTLRSRTRFFSVGMRIARTMP